MARCLYESLRAVGLQHHCDRLTSVGVRSLAHLSVLTLEDFPLLGIQTMQDRTRLFHLIQALKTLDPLTLRQAAAEGGDTGTVHGTADHSKGGGDMSSVCRKLDFSSENDPQSAKSVKLHSKVLTKAKQPGGDSAFSPSKSASKQTNQTAKTASRSKPAKEEVTPQRFWAAGKEDKSCTQSVRIYQSNTAQYNYGLPQTSAPASPSRRGDAEPRIWVCVRKRPLTPAEERRDEADVVSTPDDQSVIVHESKEAVDLTHYVLQHRFYFDRVFGEDCSNEDVYLRTARPLVRHLLSGGSSTCFAYGQTGAGKTHTMLGCSPGGAGLYALAVRDIFTHLATSAALARLGVFVSFFEIYCGQLYDLLDHRKRLFAREDGQRTVHIAGLRQVRADSVKSLLEVICRGTEGRSQGSSGVNPQSSRSHALLQIQLREPDQNIHGRMWFVDLAGSERASDSGDPDRRSRLEGAEINQSLLALKECIRSLDQEQSHTPFRQSKLTQVLRDSFVGDSMTCMIANISPVDSAAEHTLNTLRYADRVKELRAQGQQRRRRRSKNPPSPKQSPPQSLNTRGGLRGKSPPKKPKRTGPVPTPLSPDCTFLSSTPKRSTSREDGGVRRLLHLISPVTRPPAQRETETVIQGARPRRENTEDHERRRHLKLYHQQLQQFAPENAMGDILGQMEPGLPDAEANPGFGSRDERDLSQRTGVLFRKNVATRDRKCSREGERSQDGGAKWAWVSEKAQSSEEEEDAFRFGGSCESVRAPAERPLSPVPERSNSILTLSALDCPSSQKTSPKHTETPGPSAPESFLRVEGEAAVIPVCVGWEAEENLEEAYLEVPQAIGVSLVPVVMRLHSQMAERQTLRAAESHCAYTSTQNIPQDSLNSRAPPPGHSGNSCRSNRSESSSSLHLKNHGEAHWHIVQAHLETLKEMEVLSHKEGTLLTRQPDMAFVEYVQQLEDIMRRKAVCVRSMMAQLQPYLKSNHPSAQ